EKVSSLGKNWHRFCLKCERCHSILSPGGHAEHNGRPYCHKPCYGALFGPRGVNIGGVGFYPNSPHAPSPTSSISLSPRNFSPPRPKAGLPQAKKSPSYMKTFTGETSLCPGCGDPVYFGWKSCHFSPPPAEKVMSLGRNWHRPCLRCQRCRKTLTAGSHAEHDGIPYCHIPCYGYLFGPKDIPSSSPLPLALNTHSTKAHGDRTFSFRAGPNCQASRPQLTWGHQQTDAKGQSGTQQRSSLCEAASHMTHEEVDHDFGGHFHSPQQQLR
ncbi:hypothetical protein U0070_005649, partial [Myodes glareolus]